MRRALAWLLTAWFGYPGRWLLLTGLLAGLAAGLSGVQARWSQALQDFDAALPPARIAVLATEPAPAALLAWPQIHALQRLHSDGSVTAELRRPEPAPAWLPVVERRVALSDGELRLELQPLSAAQWQREGRQLLRPALAGLLLGLLLALLAQRPVRSLRLWTRALDEGRFAQSAPRLPWPLAGTAAELRVLAERLRHSRAALAERQSASDRQFRGQIRELQAELARRKQEQEAHNALGDARGEMLRTMSHEMRTPLTAIIGYADLLGRSDPSPEVGEYSGVIGRSARNLLGMINNLLDLARIEAGALQPQLSTFDISELIEDTVALLAPLAFDKKLELNTLIYHDVPTRLRGDALRIAQILTNLLSNAIKYTDSGEVVVRLMQERREADSLQLRLEVEDTGRGLDREQQQKLFQAWRRFEVAGSTAAGSGLGLAIVHKLLDVLGGRIEVHSTPGRGSRFAALIPVRDEAGGRVALPWDALRRLPVWACENHPTAAKALSHLLTFWEVDLKLFSHMGELYDALADRRSPCPARVLILGLDTDGASASAAADILGLALPQRPPVLLMAPSIDASTHQTWRARGAEAVLAKGSPRSAIYDKLLQLSGEAGDQHTQALAGLRALVADNNRAGLRILQTQLGKLGAEVLSAQSGEEALALWAEQELDLVLLDYHMPGADGRECAERMRADGRSPGAVLIGMSAWLDAADEEAWLRAGVDEVMIKPFDMERLLRVLRRRRGAAGGGREAPPGGPLLQDPEMADLLREELPRQWQALDAAFIAGSLRPLRDAAHQLHGTAAFLHLQPLQNDLAQFERLLAEARDLEDPRLPELMGRVQQNVRGLLEALNAPAAAPSPASSSAPSPSQGAE